MECTDCKYRKQVSLKRCKHFELGGDKKRKVKYTCLSMFWSLSIIWDIMMLNDYYSRVQLIMFDEKSSAIMRASFYMFLKLVKLKNWE